jgi:hypothetical protein
MNIYIGFESKAPRILISTVDGGEWLPSRCSLLIPKVSSPHTKWIGSWFGLRDGLDKIIKLKIIISYLESKPGCPVLGYHLLTEPSQFIRWFLYG